MPRIPVTTNLHIDNFTGGVVNIANSSSTNAIFNKYADGRFYATQRPSINIFEDASVTVADEKGRGIYYWDAVGARYFINDDTVYKGDYNGDLAQLMSSGSDKCYISEIGDYLLIIDPENNEGWTISSAASTTLVKITSANFPPNQAPALTLAKGMVVLNGAAYVSATNAEQFNCSTEDPTTWGAVDFISAELKPDNSVFIQEHLNHIANFGTRTIEFFYDNANPTASPLNVRTDIAHNVGAVNFDTVWANGDDIFFVNLNPAGDFNVHILSNFQLNKISTSDIDTFITSSVITDGLELMAHGFSAAGRNFYVLTTYYKDGSGVIQPLSSLVYDTSTGVWGFWELMHTGIEDFPITGWTRSTATRAGDGILANGDIVTVADDKNPQDSTEAQVYVLADYVEAGYISDTASEGENIEMILITGSADFGTREYKYADNLKIVAIPETSAQSVTVQWSDESNDNYNTGRTLDLSNHNNKLTRLGRFRQRNHKLTFSGDQQIEIESIELGIK